MNRKLHIVLVVLCAWSSPALAQWVTQQVPLRPGWNAVFIEVQPEPRALDAVFGQTPVESVWLWNKRFSPVGFEEAPEMPLPTNPHWLVWLPPSNPRSFLNSIHQVQAGKAYLVKVASNAAPVMLSLRGVPRLPEIDWYPNALNLVGFPVNPVAPPTFAEFFAHTAAVDTTKGYQNQLFTLGSNGRGTVVYQPYREHVQPGVAYWVKCAGAPDYVGPLDVTLDSGDSLDFGTVLRELGMTIRNVSSSRTIEVRVQHEPSEPPPAGQPELAGEVPLACLTRTGLAELNWHTLQPEGLSRTLAPGEAWKLQWGLRRRDLASYQPSGTNGALYQSILKITDAAQSLLVRVPVTAEGTTVRRMPLTMSTGGVGDSPADHNANEGLWVGQAVINQVSCPAYTTNLLPTASACSFRLIVHVDASGQARLLQRVNVAWEGSTTNGQFSLFASDQDLPADSPEINRISAAAFPLMSPLLLAGSMTNTLSGSITNQFDDPTNPFLHRYHPLHDNRTWDFKPYAQPIETLTVTRDIALEFSQNATNQTADPFWGMDRLGGVYRETLGGLRQQPVQVQGTFALDRVSRINQLQ